MLLESNYENLSFKEPSKLIYYSRITCTISNHKEMFILDENHVNYFSDMSSYPIMLTPPSSNEDSPPIYFVASPSSNSFQGPGEFDQGMEFTPLEIRPHVYVNPAVMEIEQHTSKEAFIILWQNMNS